jgi:hypothetical protein
MEQLRRHPINSDRYSRRKGINRKINVKKLRQYRIQKRDESDEETMDLLFSKSPLNEDDDVQEPPVKQKQTRSQKGVTFVDHTGERRRLFPKMSFW